MTKPTHSFVTILCWTLAFARAVDATHPDEPPEHVTPPIGKVVAADAALAGMMIPSDTAAQATSAAPIPRARLRRSCCG
ncbi:hypothetical protein [Microbacterium telephonicum]|uniref:hypothetical protein n=1 Tax=Microbacterium telephonicum TaxID=1714841 RepID=UPI0011C3F002|nr:hypothetical protein [Microbacterium telephonicum]